MQTVTEKLIRELRQTIEELRAKLAEAGDGTGVSSAATDDAAVSEMKDRIAKLEEEQRNVSEVCRCTTWPAGV